jgi:hypothetical protein
MANHLFKGRSLFVPKIQPKDSKMDFLRIYSLRRPSIDTQWHLGNQGAQETTGKREESQKYGFSITISCPIADLIYTVLETIDGNEEQLDMIILPGMQHFILLY